MLVKFLGFFFSFMSLFYMLTGANPTGANLPAELPEDDFIPVARIAVTSDTHIGAINDYHSRRVEKMINTAYAYADADRDYKSLDGIVFVGDISNNGRKDQFISFKLATDRTLREGTTLMPVIAKSHDSSTMGRDALAYFSSLMGGIPNDWDYVINGFHFIGLSVSSDSSVHYSDAQIQWLDGHIAAAVAENPEKPVFVFQHEHISDTVYGSNSEYEHWGMDYLTPVLTKYSQVIDISGHSHYTANDPRSIWQDTFTAIGDGGLNYFEFAVDGKNEYFPDNKDIQQQMLLVEISADNRVLVRIYDLNADEFIGEYNLDSFNDSSNFRYRHDDRKANASAPVFEHPEEFKAERKLGKVTVTVPVATPSEDDVVFLYRIKVLDRNGEVIYTTLTLSNYYYSTTPEGVTFTLSSTEAPAGSTVEVTAEDAWGYVSEPLTCGIANGRVC